MNISKHRLILLAAFAFVGFGLTACQSDKHTMVEPPPGSKTICTQCYDEVYKVTHWGSARGGAPSRQTHTRHECTSCKTEMSIYSENGVLMVKCAKCAPEGLACDKCLPPKDYVPPKLSDEPSAK